MRSTAMPKKAEAIRQWIAAKLFDRSLGTSIAKARKKRAGEKITLSVVCKKPRHRGRAPLLPRRRDTQRRAAFCNQRAALGATPVGGQIVENVATSLTKQIQLRWAD